MAIEVIAYRGSENPEGGHWYTTDREHAAYFGTVRQYKLRVRKTAKLDWASSKYAELGGYDADAILYRALGLLRADCLELAGWEGSGICYLLKDPSDAKLIEA